MAKHPWPSSPKKIFP